MHTTDHGTYVEIDGRPAVRFERIYPQSRERVWQAVTSPEEMRHWFPSPEVSIDAQEGGSITLSGDPYDPQARTTAVLAWDPPRRFAFVWGEDELHFTLTDVAQGCRLELVDIMSAEGAAARNAAGWELCLEQLAMAVAGTPGSVDAEDLADFLPVLERYKSQGLPDDGWLPEPPQG
jgi:uncharacterized protein YndB with AHSA1/START domain